MLRKKHLLVRIERLERQIKTHERFLHNDYEKLSADDNRIKNLQETVGENETGFESILAYYRRMSSWWGIDMGSDSPEPEPLTLWGAVKQMMDVLGLETKKIAGKSPETKIVKKVVKVAKKGKK